MVAEFSELYDEAMKDGYVTVQIRDVLLFGMAGTGKTSVQNLIFGLPPPEVRNSTPLAEAPKRVIRNVSRIKAQTGEGSWKPVTSEEMKQLIVDSIPLFIDKPSEIPEANTPQTIQVPAIDHKNFLGTEEADKFHQIPKYIKTKSELLPHPTTASKDVDTSLASDAAVENNNTTSYSSIDFQQAILKFIDEVRESDPKETMSGQLFKSIWIYFTDSGGQPHFHNLLPLFIQGISAALYVFRLSEGLDEHPIVEYYKDGESVSKPCPASLTTLNNFKYLVRSVYSRSEDGKLGLVCIGTHLDKASECSETLEQKNEILLQLLPEDLLRENVIFYDLGKKLIFPVDAKNVVPGREDMAKKLREAVENCPSREIDIPCWWYVFELIVHNLCEWFDKRVFSREDCLAVTNKLKIHENALTAALEFFHSHHIFHYYPHTLPGVVFCDTQVLLDKVSELVEHASSLRDSSNPVSLRGNWLDFRDRGIITLEFIKKFKKHYVANLFGPLELIKIFKDLLILTPLSGSLHGDVDLSSDKTEYFMPSLLDTLPQSDLEGYRVLSSEATPLIFRFPNGWPRCGVFCCLQVYLIQYCNWELCLDQIKPMQNIVQLQPPDSHCIVTLIDSLSYVEVHAEALTEDCASEYTLIQDNVFRGIIASCKALRYNQDPPEMAFVCPCDREEPQTEAKTRPTCTPESSAPIGRHIAVISKKQTEMKCTINRRKFYTLKQQHTLWLANTGSNHLSGITHPPSCGFAGASTPPSTIFAWQHWGLDRLQDKAITGEGTNIAILDTGINCKHVAFSHTSIGGRNFITGHTDHQDINDVDSHCHGTSVAGIAAGKHILPIECTLPDDMQMQVDNMPILPIGVAPNASLFIFRVSKSKYDPYDPDAVIKSLECIRDHNNGKQTEEHKRIHIVTMPFRLSENNQQIRRLIDVLKLQNVICVAAAGNDGLNQSTGYPARYNSVLTVGSVDSYGRISNFSTSDQSVDVLALGEEVLVPVNHSESGGTSQALDTCYLKLDSGTSFAAPAVAGLIALLLQYARKYSKDGTAIEHITDLDVLKQLFKKYMIIETEQGKLLQPEKVLYFFNNYAQCIDAVVKDFLR